MSASAVLLGGVRLLAWGGFLASAARLSTRDWRVQKIAHGDLLLGAALAAGAYALLASNSLLGAAGKSEVYHHGAFFVDLASHFALSVLAALGLWKARIWPAGDAKLFLLLAAILPLLPREPDFEGGRLFLSALINVFLPACVFVFLQVARYAWHTRLKHSAGFLRQLGASRAVNFFLGGARDAATALGASAVAALLSARERPGAALLGLARWGASFVLMSGVAASLQRLLPSGAARTALSFGCLFVLIRAQQAAGQAVLWIGAALAAFAFAAAPAESSFRVEMLRSFGSLSVFGLFVQLGAMWTMGLLGGSLHWAMIPVLGLAAGAIPALLGAAGGAFSWAVSLLPLAALGGFFGLCHVLVRLWEDEDRPLIPLDNIRAYMVPHDSFLETVEREDPDFRERHLSDIYADGLTWDQVKAVRAWCRRHGHETMPMHSTMSFAFWIFLGYFLTWLLGGHVLRFAI